MRTTRTDDTAGDIMSFSSGTHSHENAGTDHIFPLIITPPPPPTLFPYTTLFRSHPAERHRAGAIPDGRRVVAADAFEADRKSTRLNSSHRCISYAVFCLKKKKRREHRTSTL